MVRIGKHKGCGGEFVASEIDNDNITEVTCKRCRKNFNTRIVSKNKKEFIREFNKTTNKKLTLEDFEKFNPINNKFDTNASFDGAMFETYGVELSFVKKQNPQNIWTYVDGDNGTYIINGFHYVNRIGYFITKVPWKKGKEYEIIVDED